MDSMVADGYWLLWLFIVVIYPFKIYDFVKEADKKFVDYAEAMVYTFIAAVSAVGTFVSDCNIAIDNKSVCMMVGIAYIQSAIDCKEHRTKRNIAFFCVFTFSIICYIIKKILL